MRGIPFGELPLSASGGPVKNASASAAAWSQACELSVKNAMIILSAHNPQELIDCACFVTGHTSASTRQALRYAPLGTSSRGSSSQGADGTSVKGELNADDSAKRMPHDMGRHGVKLTQRNRQSRRARLLTPHRPAGCCQRILAGDSR
jgi:hypothetical protein